MKDVALVAAGGAIGASLRWLLGGWIADRIGVGFPWHTMAINLSGALLLGVLMGLSLDGGLLSADWRIFLGTGLLGGYTTFSTLAYETVALLEQGLYARAAFDMFGTGALGVMAAVIGIAIGRAV